MRELIRTEGDPSAGRCRLLTRRKPHAEARGRARAPTGFPELKAVCAVSPTMDLAACVEALERKVEHRVRVQLRPQPEGAHAAGRPSLSEFLSARSLPRICDRAPVRRGLHRPHHGFQDASDYYHRASATACRREHSRAALILTAEDDPFVPTAPFYAEPSGAIRDYRSS
jgi:hypothetical protein